MLSLGVFPLLPSGLYDCVIFGDLYPSKSESRPQLHSYLLFFFWSHRRGHFQQSSPVGLGISWRGDHFISSDSASCCCHACVLGSQHLFLRRKGLFQAPASVLPAKMSGGGGVCVPEGEPCMCALDRKGKRPCSVCRMGFGRPFWGELSFLQRLWFL